VANAQRGNSWYVDSTGTLTTNKNQIVKRVVITPTSANAVLVLQDDSTTTNKCDLRAATSGDSKDFDFGLAPLVFPGGIKVTTLTNCVALIITAAAPGA
jgi:hypothetical protein